MLKIIGHRGAKGLAEENTATAIKKAIAEGVDMVEVDVRVTPNGVPVLHHNRLPNTTAGLTTLDQALKLVSGKVPLYIEVKAGEDIAPIAEILSKYQGKYFVASKNQRTLSDLHQSLPKAPTIVIEPWSGIRARRRARQLGATMIAMNKWWLWGGFIKVMARDGYELYAYPLNDPRKAKRWEKFGLAGVITDYPDRF